MVNTLLTPTVCALEYAMLILSFFAKIPKAQKYSQ